MKKEINLIFDVQLFAGTAESVTGTSAAETITVVSNTSVKIQKDGEESETTKTPKTTDAFSLVGGGSGADTLKVAVGPGLSIVGGRGHDSIDITAHGNTYVYNNGDGKDTISGWGDGDVLLLNSAPTTLMSEDGKSFIVSVGSGSITFDGIDATSGKKVKVIYPEWDDSAEEMVQKTAEYTPQRIRQGSTKADDIDNASTGSVEGSAGAEWTIDGGIGNDTITNAGKYVSIGGGNGNDKITVQAGSAVTSGVTINGGIGNDTIDVSGDSVTGADPITGEKVGGHVYEYAPSDGKDTIIGFNSNDTIVLKDFDLSSPEGLEQKNYIIANSGFDTLGNYIIKFYGGTITLKNTNDDWKGALGGTTLNIKIGTMSGADLGLGTPVDEDGEEVASSADHYIIPKKVLGGTGVDNVEIDSDYDGYSYNAQGGGDEITISSGNVSVNAAVGNDKISLGGGTNVKDDGSLNNGTVVTVVGGLGNDSINATGDKKTVTVGGEEKVVFASHVYQFGSADGRDSIYGFNENDIIQVVKAEGETDYPAVSSGWDTTGKNYIVYIGSTQIYLVGYGGGNKLKVQKEDGTAFPVGTHVGLDADGNETTVEADIASGDYYIVPKQLIGTTGSDNTAEKKLTLGSDKENFTIDAKGGHDSIEVYGASGVSINAGAGNDSINIFKYEEAGKDDKYGEYITIEGGAGNDTIIAESVTAAKPVADVSAEGHTYIFGASDGNDIVYGFKDTDTIRLRDNTYFINSSVSGDDLVLNFSSNKNATRPSSTMTLKNYVDAGRDNIVRIADINGENVSEKPIPKVTVGTNGGDELSNNSEGYEILAYAGNDSILNESIGTSANQNAEDVIIDAGAGDDTVINSGNNASINAGVGNDRIYIFGDAVNVNVSVGTGNDSIFANDEGGQIYYFGDNDGTNNYIFNFNANDRLYFKSENSAVTAPTPNFTEAGVVFQFGNTKVIVKGALKEADDADHITTILEDKVSVGSSASFYENVEAATSVQYTYKIASAAETKTSYKVPKMIWGTNGHDRNGTAILNTEDEYVIKAQAGNDVVFSEGSQISIDAGLGNDTVILGEEAEGSVMGGAGNDFIANIGGEDAKKVYVYNVGDGNDTILGFNSGDILSIVGASDIEYASVTANGFEVRVGGNTILLKGQATDAAKTKIAALKTAIAAGDDIDDADYPTAAEYDLIAGGTFVSIKCYDGTTTHDHSKEVPKEVYYTNSGEEVTIPESLSEYAVYGLNGNDTIKNNGADDVTIYGGVGDDYISLKSSGDGVKVVAGVGNDSIDVQHKNNIAHLFEFTLGDGDNTINGINAEDTINITGVNVSVQSAEFDTNDYFVLTLNDNRTKIRIKESNNEDNAEDQAYQKPGTNTASFTLQINGVAQGEEGTYPIPKIESVTRTTEVTFDSTKDKAIIIGNYASNKINLDGASYTSVSAGAGNDEITVQGSASENIIDGGYGNDKIYIKTSGQLIQYRSGEGNDTIYGISEDDTLQLIGNETEIETLMSGKTFSVKYGGYSITFKNADGNDIDAGTTINLASEINLKNGSPIESITVPKLLQGTSGSDKDAKKLENAEGNDEYEIDAQAGNDEIVNAGHRVTIEAGAGKDTVTSTGDDVVINGDANADSIVASGDRNSINAGADNDFVRIGSTAVGTTIKGGKGNDTLIGNELGNVYEYAEGDGNDTILGYGNDDTIVLSGDITPSVDAGGNIAYKLTSDGIRLYLVDSSDNDAVKGNLLFKGQRIDETAVNNNKLSAFDPLAKDTKITFKFNDGTSKVFEVPAIKEVTKNTPLTNEDGDYTINGSTGADTITNSGYKVHINGDKGADLIKNTGSHVTINGGDDNDIILINEGKDALGNAIALDPEAEAVTIRGGAGDDTIYGNTNGDGNEAVAHVYQYNPGDGKDVIFNFGLNDVIEFLSEDLKGDTVKPYSSVEFNNTTKKVTVQQQAKTEAGELLYDDDSEAGTTENQYQKENESHQRLYYAADGTTETTAEQHQESDTSRNALYWTDNTKTEKTTESRHQDVDGTGNLLYYVDNSEGAETTTETTEYPKWVMHDAVMIDNARVMLDYEPKMEDVEVDVDDPAYKDVVIRLNGGSITIKKVPIDQEIKYQYKYYTESGEPVAKTYHNETGTIQVSKVHQLSGSEGSSEENKFINTTEGYKIVGTANADYISNTAAGEEASIVASAGNNSIGNAAEKVSITAGVGNDTVINSGANTTIDASAGENVINNTGDNVTITTGKDNDTITNTGAGAVINAGNGDNTISNDENADGTEITTGEGKDTITSKASEVTITTGKGNDVINVDEASDDAAMTIEAGEGNDTIYANSSNDRGRKYIYSSGDGNDTISGWSGDDVLQLKLDTGDTISTDADATGFTINIKNSAGEITGSILLTNLAADGTKTALGGGTEINVIDGSDAPITNLQIPKIVYAIGSTSVTSNENDAYLIKGDSSNNTITSFGNQSTINADAGSDVIYVGGEETSVNAGAGNDSIFVASTIDNDHLDDENEDNRYTAGSYDAMTIEAGTGNDYIKAKAGHTDGIVYKYTVGDGNDSIINYSEDDTINIIGDNVTYTTSVTGEGDDQDFLIRINNNNNNTILLKGYKHEEGVTKHVTIVRGTYSEDSNPILEEILVPYVVSIPGSEEYINDKDEALVYGTNGQDTISNEANKVAIYGLNGNDYISLASGDDVSVYAGAGRDTIENEDALHAGVVYVFGGNDGQNTITNFSEDDSIQYTGGILEKGTNLTSLASGGNLTLNLGGTSIYIPEFGKTGKTIHLYDTAVDREDAKKTFTIGNIKVGDDTDNVLDNTGINTDGSVYNPNGAENAPIEIKGYGGNDEITNSGNYVTIDAGYGDDTVKNSGKNVTIDGGDGNDQITLESDGDTVIVDGGYGNDEIIYKGGNNVSINGGEGNDKVTINAVTSGPSNKLTVYGGAGIDTIVNNDSSNGHIYQFTGDNANNGGVIKGFTTNDTIQILDTNTVVGAINQYSYVGDSFLLTVGRTRISLQTADGKPLEAGTELHITDKDSHAIEESSGVNYKVAKVQKASGSFSVTDAGFYVFGTGESNTITNSKANVTIEAGYGNDTVDNSGDGASIYGGDGDDSIKTTVGNVTIYSGSGNDTIKNEAGSGSVVYQFDRVSGNNTIEGFNPTDDKISLTSSANAPNNVSLNTADGTISFTEGNTRVTLKGSDAFTASTSVPFVNNNDQAKPKTPNYILLKKSTADNATAGDDTSAAITADTVNIYAFDGNDTITVSGKNSNLFASEGGVKKVSVTLSGNEEGTGVYILTGIENDTIDNSANYSTFVSGDGNDSVKISGNNNTLEAGAGNDTVEFAGEAKDNTVYGGAGDDSIKSNGKGNIFYYTRANEGNDTINGFDLDKDIIQVNSGNVGIITGEAVTGGVKISIGTNSTTILLEGKAAGDEIKFKFGNANPVAYTVPSGPSGSSGSYVAEAPIAVLDDIFEDDNFITNDAQISSITEITADNFSAGKIEAVDYASLVQNNSTPIAYGSKK